MWYSTFDGQAVINLQRMEAIEVAPFKPEDGYTGPSLYKVSAIPDSSNKEVSYVLAASDRQELCAEFLREMQLHLNAYRATAPARPQGPTLH